MNSGFPLFKNQYDPTGHYADDHDLHTKPAPLFFLKGVLLGGELIDQKRKGHAWSLTASCRARSPRLHGSSSRLNPCKNHSFISVQLHQW